MTSPNPDPVPVRLIIDNAATLAPPPDETELLELGGGGPPAPEGGLPPGFPVTPLGQSLNAKGELLNHYLDPSRRLRSLKDEKHGRLVLVGLFGAHQEVLETYWPRRRHISAGKRAGGADDERWIVTGWHPDEVARVLISACARKGTIDLREKRRGTGAWLGEDGRLVLHCGDRVLIGQAWRRPGEHGGFTYPTDAPIPKPSATMAIGGTGGPAAHLLKLLGTWNWARPQIDPHLLLGWIGAAKIGGALPWRPGIYVTGETGSGKSTLLDHTLCPIFGDGGVIAVGDSSAAGIAQRLQWSTLPMICDELEATTDDKAQQAILELRRAAASGSTRLRGSPEQEASVSVLRFCALFSAINAPAMSPQDLNRSTFCKLAGPPQGALPPLDAKKLKALSEALTCRLIDNWDRLKTAIEIYKTGLIKGGHTARGAGQYGIMLACADILLHDHAEIVKDELDLWVERLAPQTEEIEKESRLCLQRLLDTPLEPRDLRTLSQVIHRVIEKRRDEPWSSDRDAELRHVNNHLARHGLRILPLKNFDEGHPTGFQLAIANSHKGLGEVFRNTRWGGQAGKVLPYPDQLRALPGAVRAEKTVSIGNRNARVTLLPLSGADAILGEDD